MKEMIRTQGLSKEYGGELKVCNVCMDVPPEKIYGFLGPNGAGKSTTLKMILGLARPTKGEIDIFGKRMTQKNRIQILRQIGSLIESPSYYGHLTGIENLKIMQTLLDVPSRNINKVLQIVRLTNQADKKVDHYSLGMKQRLGIASAMLSFPKLLILDEPTNGLDPAGIQEMRELVLSMPKEYGMTVLVSSHLLSEIDQIADVVGIIDDGKLVFQNSLFALHEKSNTHIALRTGNNETARQILSENGVPSTLEDGYMILEQTETDQAISLYNRLLVQNHIDVLRIEERKHSLEDIFLDLTGKAASL